MKEIKLTQGYSAMVDDIDYDYLSQWKWYIFKGKHTNYAVRVENKKSIFLHRQIMNPPTGMIIDHKDHNGLNCQRENMRICTYTQNSVNRRPSGKSKYLGVSYVAPYKKTGREYITAGIKFNGKTVHLGYFKTEEDAALAYNIAAKEYYNEFAYLNKI